MAKAPSATHAVAEQRQHLPPHEKEERKRRVLTHNVSSIVRSITDAIVIKDADLFFLCQPDGDVSRGGNHGFGLYYHDCRYLHGYEMRIAGARADPLVATAGRDYGAVIQLTNPDLRMASGALIAKQEIGIEWLRVVDGESAALEDLITFENLGLQEVEFPVSLTFEAAFEDIFTVRGMFSEEHGTVHPPQWDDGRLRFAYDGQDGIRRTLDVAFSPSPTATDGTTAMFTISLPPRHSAQILVSLAVAEEGARTSGQLDDGFKPDLKHVEDLFRRTARDWLGQGTQVESDSILLNRIIDRSLRDLRMLRSTIHGHAYFAAGLPWFGTLFGRDSLITALQTLAFNPGIAAQTLRVLARYQGEKVDPWRDEEPGKILHEFRVGELANLNEVPYTPYYGSIDSTPLFLILMARYLAWTADLQLFSDLRENVERALQWMARYGDSDGDGYLDYKSRSEKGLVNQGWKDSGDAIVNSDGSLAEPPIALVEVQGYAYLAKQALADLFARVGDQDRANQLRHVAEDLRERFNRDFWMADKEFYALALQQGGRKADVVASNPGQALWTGIADHDKAVTTARRLVADDVYSGWGVRTLSARERRFNPVGYHLGTVWPHDNSIIAAGFRRYGLRDETMKVFNGITQAAMYFEHNRLPEVFAGYDREDYGVPVHYPVACHPQAWAAGSVPFLLTTLLGLQPEALDRRLRIYHPLLPEYVHFLRLRNLRVGDARTDLSFERAPSGGIAVNVLSVSGELDIVVEPGLPSP